MPTDLDSPPVSLSALPEHLQKDVRLVGSLPSAQTLVDIVCRATGMGFSAIARVTETHWVACAVKDNISFGLMPGGELKIETTICQSIQQLGEPVVIADVDKDPFYCSHHTPAIYGFKSYVSVPIRRNDGTFFGTLCAIDPGPKDINIREIREMFELFADMIAEQLDAADHLSNYEEKLRDAAVTGDLRDQFIAILGHDLRNPVSAISASAEMLRMSEISDDNRSLTNVISRSVLRIRELIDNVLDFARGRMGDGIQLQKKLVKDPATPLNHVIHELSTAWPQREISSRLDLPSPLYCDIDRIGQVLSNLLANALTYGDKSSPVTIHASATAELFELSVTNQGPAISPKTMKRLFEPFSRGEVKPARDGLGLGLYIAYQIAKAHSGDISVLSNENGTTFSFRMPLPST